MKKWLIYVKRIVLSECLLLLVIISVSTENNNIFYVWNEISEVTVLNLKVHNERDSHLCEYIVLLCHTVSPV